MLLLAGGGVQKKSSFEKLLSLHAAEMHKAFILLVVKIQHGSRKSRVCPGARLLFFKAQKREGGFCKWRGGVGGWVGLGAGRTSFATREPLAFRTQRQSKSFSYCVVTIDSLAQARAPFLSPHFLVSVGNRNAALNENNHNESLQEKRHPPPLFFPRTFLDKRNMHSCFSPPPFPRLITLVCGERPTPLA